MVSEQAKLFSLKSYKFVKCHKRLFFPIIVFTAIVIAGFLLFPRAILWSDEAAYIATSYRIGETFRVLAATHLPIDILTYGTEHKPIHMPVYMIVLAGW